MATQGPLGPVTAVDDATVGTVAWGTPTNVTADDASYATFDPGGGASILEVTIKLVKGGTVSGNNKSTGATLGGVEGYVSYGGVADLWGLTLLDTDINSPNFGFVVSYKEFIGTTSHYLKCTNFGFSIPSGATINGLLLEIKALDDGTPRAKVNYARITVTYTTDGVLTQQVRVARMVGWY